MLLSLKPPPMTRFDHSPTARTAPSRARVRTHARKGSLRFARFAALEMAGAKAQLAAKGV
jgi:hypothetical protein